MLKFVGEQYSFLSDGNGLFLQLRSFEDLGSDSYWEMEGGSLFRPQVVEKSSAEKRFFRYATVGRSAIVFSRPIVPTNND